MNLQTFNLFSDPPSTEGIKYAGSKLKLIPYILKLAEKVSPKTVLDGFSGSTRVAQAFAKVGYSVMANDLAVWSSILGKCYLMNHAPISHYQKMIDHLNAIKGVDGWFTQHYGGSSKTDTSMGLDGKKKPWQSHNTQKLDAIRNEIERMNLTTIEKSVLLTSLILALDEVDSTLGHFASYLNKWSARSYKTLKLKVPKLFYTKATHSVNSGDIFDLLPKVSFDLAYFDPPYGSNNEKMPPSRVRYSAYYHIWSTICLNDKPEIFGMANRRSDSSDTISQNPFEDFRRSENGRFVAVEAIERLLTNTQAKHIILSYSSGGRATASELNDSISKIGTVLELQEIDYRKNVMSSMCWTNEWVADANKPNREFLFLIKRN